MPETRHVNQPVAAEVWTEGKTDWQLLRLARKRLGLLSNLSFRELTADMGESKLLQRCQIFAEKPNILPLIFVFDRDVPLTVAQVSDPNGSFKSWGNNVYSLAIPLPGHRSTSETVSIELYFTDAELKTTDPDGKRLFLTSEFNPVSGKLVGDATISIGDKGRLTNCTDPRRARVVDSDVYDASNRNIALSKSNFTSRVCNGDPGFGEFGLKEFGKIFRLIDEIIDQSRPRADVYYPELDGFFETISSKESVQQLADIFGMMVDVVTTALQIFSVVTIRCYEEQIVRESDRFRTRAPKIKEVLRNEFAKPSLAVVQTLAFRCFLAVDGSAPSELAAMKTCLEVQAGLGDLGKLLDDLEAIFPLPAGTVPRANKPMLRWGLLRDWVPELAKYAEHRGSELQTAIALSALDSASLVTWKGALAALTVRLEPIFVNRLVLSTVERHDPSTGEYLIAVESYQDHRLERTRRAVSPQVVDDIQSRATELVFADGRAFGLFPFLLVKDGALYFYRRTRASSHEYCAPGRSEVYCRETRRKFSRAVFATASMQELFWTSVIPTVNPKNGIKANIPGEGLEGFVGRRKQLRTITDEVIDVPHQHGVIYGPGGIGKTALMQQLSQELFDEPDRAKVRFRNIVWVSGKTDFYDYLQADIQRKGPQVQSLEHILTALLTFFETEGADEYSLEERKELLLEVLQDQSVLLVLDNLESLPLDQTKEVVRFFGIDAKRLLPDKPFNLKVMITSRRQIQCAFQPIELTGLDLREGKSLITNLQKRYEASGFQLTDEQQTRLHTATKGVPLVIRHCIFQVFEYNQPFSTVVDSLCGNSGELVEFSFKEILQLIEKRDKDAVHLKILLLLDIVNGSLMLRQIADILEIEEPVIEKAVPALMDYQCLKRLNQDGREKYYVSDEISLLTKTLAQRNQDLVEAIRDKITRNFSLDKQLDYTSEERTIIAVFEGKATTSLLDAKDYIQEQREKHPDSVLIDFHYARFLRERMQTSNEAMEILERIREPSANNPSILWLLVQCHLDLEIPDFEHASQYVQGLEKSELDDELILALAGFYVRWSSAIKRSRIPSQYFDPLEEMLRQQRYKDKAESAVRLLDSLKRKTHEAYYLYSEAYNNLWDNQEALAMINTAISYCPDVQTKSVYARRRDTWLKNISIHRYAGSRSGGSRDPG
jgi:GTPase SAR1 family protein